ncbi:hypothetical protein G7054_g14156 [Neopestalotiopsis clavispora]|nr:hypothetical protein G7054_g14156 [Neopestalotiopsis clavispora]
MSGLEVAGILLGAIPLVIKALDKYESIFDAGQALTHYKGRLQDTRDELLMERTWYDKCLRLVLTGLVNTQILESMIDSDQSEHWRDKDLHQSLLETLGNDYNGIFLVLVKKVQRCMATVEGILDSAGSSAITTKTGQSPDAGTKPATSDRWQSTIKSLLVDIRDCNERLLQFITYMSNKHGTIESKNEPTRPSARMETPLHKIQEYASKLHSVLAEAWSGCLHQSHSAYLLLEDRTCLNKGQNVPPKFRLQFENPTGKSWKFGEAKVRTILRPEPRAQVRFKEISQPDDSSEQDFENLSIVNDLCQELHDEQNGSQCFGLCLNEDGSLRGKYPTKPLLPSPVGQYLTLAEIIAIKRQHWEGLRRWTAEDQLVLSVNIASSFLQLRQSKWIDPQWNADSIVFEKPFDSSASIDVHCP